MIFAPTIHLSSPFQSATLIHISYYLSLNLNFNLMGQCFDSLLIIIINNELKFLNHFRMWFNRIRLFIN